MCIFAPEHLDVSIGVRLALYVEVAVSLLIRGAGQRGFWHSPVNTDKVFSGGLYRLMVRVSCVPAVLSVASLCESGRAERTTH